jgi:hypothetical protein
MSTSALSPIALLTALALGGCSLPPIQLMERDLLYGGVIHATEWEFPSQPSPCESTPGIKIDTSDPSGRWRDFDLLLCNGASKPLADITLLWCEEQLAAAWLRTEESIERGEENWDTPEFFRSDAQWPDLEYRLFDRITLTFSAGKLSQMVILATFETPPCDRGRLIDRATGGSFTLPPHQDELESIYGSPVVLTEDLLEF